MDQSNFFDELVNAVDVKLSCEKDVDKERFIEFLKESGDTLNEEDFPGICDTDPEKLVDEYFDVASLTFKNSFLKNMFILLKFYREHPDIFEKHKEDSETE